MYEHCYDVCLVCCGRQASHLSILSARTLALNSAHIHLTEVFFLYLPLLQAPMAFIVLCHFLLMIWVLMEFDSAVNDSVINTLMLQRDFTET